MDYEELGEGFSLYSEEVKPAIGHFKLLLTTVFEHSENIFKEHS